MKRTFISAITLFIGNAFAQAISRTGNVIEDDSGGLGGSSAGVGIVYSAFVVGAIAVWLFAGYRSRQQNKTSLPVTTPSPKANWNWRLIASCFVAFWAWKLFFIWSNDTPKPPVYVSVDQPSPAVQFLELDVIKPPEPPPQGQTQPAQQYQPSTPPPPTQAEKDAALKQQQANRQAAADLDERAARAVAAYPYLDTPAGADTLQKIIDYRDEQIRGGTYPALALTRAVNKYAPGNDPRGLR